MRYLFYCLLSLGLSISLVNAQKFSLKVSGGMEMPIGIFKEGYKTGWGVYGAGYYALDESANLLMTVGTAGWGTQESNNNSGLIFLRPGYRQFIYNGIYFQGEAGVAIYTGFWGNSPTRFSYSVGSGYLFGTKERKGLDVLVKFNRASYRSWFSFNLGYQFSL